MHNPPEDNHARSSASRTIWLTLFAATILLGSCFWYMTDSYNRLLRKDIYHDTASLMNTRASSLKLAIERRLMLAGGLKAYVDTALMKQPVLNQAEFDAFSGSFIQSLDGVRNLSVYPDGIAQYVYPLATNEAIIGMDLFQSTNPDIRANAERTRLTTAMTVFGPFELTQGGLGLLSRQSIVRDGKFWGFVSVVLDVPPILKEAGMNDDDSGRIKLALKANGSLLLGDPKLPASKSSLRTSIPLDDGNWELYAVPGQSKLNAVKNRVEIKVLGFLMVLLLVNYLIYVQMTRRHRLQELVRERTFHLTDANQRLEATYEELVATEDELRLQYTLLANSERDLRQVAYRDSVTGLYNRIYFQERLDETIAQANARNRPFALLFLDLDQFKLINDTLGHACGDLLLQEVGNRLSALLGQDESFARIGGDEFTIILPTIRDTAHVQEAANQIIQAFRQPFILQDIDYYVTVSIGVTLFPEHSRDAAELMKYADAAMYRAKEEGKNNYHFYDETLYANTEEKIYIKNSLRRALDNDEFEVYYQPQIEIESKRIVGLEALIRWKHPKRGNIPPSEFIPIAEECGLMEPIGEWVLRTVCYQNKAWQDAGLPPVRTAVNLSARQFTRNNRLAEQIKGILQESGLDPAYLELEITENTAMKHDNSVTLQELRDLAITISIDDFGTHYSSLNYLKRLPVDKIKIDRSFVDGIRKEPKDEAIILAMLLMASHLNLTIVAEGVETHEQLAFLQHNNCDDIQGYLYYKPQPADEIERILREH